jgi:hypothetical protein
MKYLKHFPVLLPLAAVLFNLWVLYPEVSAPSEVNDNVFAYVLVVQMNKAWDYGHCPLSLSCLPSLSDFWTSTFAFGFPLPHYYQHIPHLVPVVIYRFLSLFSSISLYSTFEWCKYLLLAVFPLSVYWSARKLGLSPPTSAFASIIAPLISTQYLYGTDYNAVVWRGSGMYTQLWGFVAAPMAFASLYDTLRFRRAFLRSALLCALAFAGHLIFGYLVTLSAPVMALAIYVPELLDQIRKPFKEINLTLRLRLLLRLISPLVIVLSLTFAFLAYWAVPLILDNAWQNSHSVWDGRDKFDSYGALAVTQKLFNGDLFDNNRLPVLTTLIFIGLFVCLIKYVDNFEKEEPLYLILPLLFIEWYFLYWGRAGWGSLIDLLPMADGIHLHRFINGLHLSGMFLGAIGLSWVFEKAKETLNTVLPRLILVANPRKRLLNPAPWMAAAGSLVAILIVTAVVAPAIQERYKYLDENFHILNNYLPYYQADMPDFLKTVQFLQSRPGRIWPGRPGNWGNNFNIGGTHAFMQFSIADIDVSGFLPETWSPNSDVEQFFSEDRFDHFQAFGIKTIVAPPDHQVPSFAKKIAQFGKFVIYDVPGVTEFEMGTVPFEIVADKKSDLTITRLWLESGWPSFRSHPVVSLTDQFAPGFQGPFFKMLDESGYLKDGKRVSLFASNPFIQPAPATPSGEIVAENRAFNRFSASVEIPASSASAWTVLKTSFHPSWKATVDNQPAQIVPVAPVFMAVALPPCLPGPCTHQIQFTYGASTLKTVLLYGAFILLGVLLYYRKKLDAFILKNLSRVDTLFDLG